MDTRTDRRVRRTRQALVDALLALMAEKPYDHITVHELSDRADVGRSTFYGHFVDKDALLDTALDELRTIAASPRPSHGLSLSLLTHIAEHRQLAAAILGPPGATTVAHKVRDVVEQAVAGSFADLIPTGGLPPKAYICYITGAYLALVQWWLEDGQSVPAAELDRFFRQATSSAFR
ncbi:TetR/AcrR family transcriptional regulator [Longispora sp. K20-0274]|uniref:TetR/AcrR family transcriptional regulator n=1 Tax=Longispora sp. K20-0274 TaxID=3088255 RepID=UPI00399A64D1